MLAWLNKNILAFGLVSFFTDFGNEMAAAILPIYITTLGGSAEILGFIEGIADASISFTKIISGWYSDYINKRKPFATIGYSLASIGLFILYLSTNLLQVLTGRVISRLGKGIREPARDALLANSSSEKFYGRVFGFHRAMDTLGAIFGPLTAFILIKLLVPNSIFLVALVPTLISLVIIIFMVQEPIFVQTEKYKIFSSFKNTPTQFKFFLIAAGIFSLGNFTGTLLIMRASQIFSLNMGKLHANSLAILFYTIYNIFYASFSFPIGHLADKIGKKIILFFGYLIFGIASIGLMLNITSIFYILGVFILYGISMAIIDGIERSLVADLIQPNLRGTGYGSLATIKGIGAFFSSTLVGYLWTRISPAFGFGYSAIFCLAGAIFFLILNLLDLKKCR